MVSSSSVPRPEAERAPDEEYATSFSLLADAVGQFVDAWEADGDAPVIDEYLPADASMRKLVLVELIKVDLEYRWVHGGEPKRLGEYVTEYPELREGPPVELLYEEFHFRKQSGLNIQPEEYVEEFPQHAETIQQWLGRGDEYQSTVITKASDMKVLDSVEAGTTIDDFDLVLELGRGAFARVFLARQKSMQRMVALKVSANRGTEPQTLAQLDHDAIVRVFDQHEVPESGLRLLYMQYLSGGTLQEAASRVRKSETPPTSGQLLLDVVDEELESRGNVRPTESPLRAKLQSLSWAETVAWIGSRLAEGLNYAHAKGVLHRDIKPANVLLSAEGAPKLADFNISFSDSVEGSTPAAYFGGSLAYMSPEQLEAAHPGRARQADELDGRSDVYSLGVMLWELLTGERPFDQGKMDGGWAAAVESMLDIRMRGVEPQRLDASKVDCPPNLRRVLCKCLAPERELRWPDAGQLAGQLALCLDQRAGELLDPPTNSWQVKLRRWGVWVILMANLLPNALAAWFNNSYVWETIVEHFPDETAKEKFNQLVNVINGTAFPVGILLIIWLSWRVISGLKTVESGTAPSRDSHGLHRECLRLAERCALVCLALWTIAGFTYPIYMHIQAIPIDTPDAIHWVSSLVVSGLVAVAYPFFGVAYFAVRSIYPAFLHHQAPDETDERELSHLKSRLAIYLVIAGSVPLLAIGGLTMVAAGSEDGTASIVFSLCVGGSLGLAVVYFVFFQNLQTDLDALLRVVRGGSQRSAG
ncbi:MAG: serine/threonine protein kinase [Planctomycetaceae bacterium]|nr:serine/threonine protein kinase [Planctomycetaceae bacterium]